MQHGHARSYLCPLRGGLRKEDNALHFSAEGRLRCEICTHIFSDEGCPITHPVVCEIQEQLKCMESLIFPLEGKEMDIRHTRAICGLP